MKVKQGFFFALCQYREVLHLSLVIAARFGAVVDSNSHIVTGLMMVSE